MQVPQRCCFGVRPCLPSVVALLGTGTAHMCGTNTCQCKAPYFPAQRTVLETRYLCRTCLVHTLAEFCVATCSKSVPLVAMPPCDGDPTYEWGDVAKSCKIATRLAGKSSAPSKGITRRNICRAVSVFRKTGHLIFVGAQILRTTRKVHIEPCAIRLLDLQCCDSVWLCCSAYASKMEHI